MTFHALDGLLKQVPILQEALDTIERGITDNKSRATASGFQKQLEEFEFYYCLVACHKVFEMTDILSKQLQSTSTSAGEGITSCRFTVANLQSLRSEDAFEVIWNEAIQLSETQESAGPKLPRQKKRPTRYDDEGDHVFGDPKSYYRHTFFKMLDWLIGHLKARVEEKAPQILSCIERLFFSAWSGNTIPQDDLEIVCQHFGADLDRNRLMCQLSRGEHASEQYKTVYNERNPLYNRQFTAESHDSAGMSQSLII